MTHEVGISTSTRVKTDEFCFFLALDVYTEDVNRIFNTYADLYNVYMSVANIRTAARPRPTTNDLHACDLDL